MIKRDDRVSSWQMFIIILSAVNAIEVITFPRQLADSVGPDGWAVLIGGHVLLAVGLFIIIKLGLLFPEHTFADYAPKIAGKFIGSFFVLIAVVFWLLVTARIVRQFSDFMRLILVGTPIEVIILSILLTAAYVARHGIEPLARMVEILFPVFIGLIGLLILIIVPTMELGNLSPVLCTDVSSLTSSSVEIALGLEGKGLLLMLLPFMLRSGDAYKVGFAALGTNLILRVVLFVAAISVLGVDLAKTLVWPVEELSRTAAFPGAFFGRLDALFIALWVTVAFTSILVYYYTVSLTFSRLLKFREHSLVVLPFLPIIFIVSLIPENIVETEMFADQLSILFGVLAFGIPLVLLITTYIRGTHKKISKGD